MRHYYSIFLAVFALFSITACNQVEFQGLESAVQCHSLTFEASFADNVLTKTQYVDGTVQYGNILYMNWVPGDQINLYFNDSEADGPFVSTLTSQDGPKASSGFGGTISFATGEDAEAGGQFDDYFFAYYPYSSSNSISNGVISTSLPAEQSSVDNNIASNLLPSAARSENLRLYFYKVASVFRFKPSRSDILYVEYSGRNNEILAGDFTFSFGLNEDNKMVPIVTLPSTGYNTIRLYAPDGGTFKADKWYYLVMLPQVMTQGYTFKAYTASQVGTYTQTESRDQTRGKYNQYGSMATTMTWSARTDIFSVSANKKVIFAHGNLKVDNSVYSVHANDYDCCFTGFNATWNSTNRDLFTFSEISSFTGADLDHSIPNISTSNEKWRVLTKDEWVYLIDNKTSDGQDGVRTGIRYAKAKVAGFLGLIIFPDAYTHPSGLPAIDSDQTSWVNQYDAYQWFSLSAAGAVFLPSTGYYDHADSKFRDLLGCGYYRSTSKDNHAAAISLYFYPVSSDSKIKMGAYGVNADYMAVRPVRDYTE